MSARPYVYLISMVDEENSRTTREITAENTLAAVYAVFESLAVGERIVAVEERGLATFHAASKSLPAIYGWCDKTTDPLRPGFTAHAIATDGTILAHRVVHSDQAEHARRAVESLDAEYREQYPDGYQFIWVAAPREDYRLIAARLRPDHSYLFEPLDPPANDLVRMRCARTKRIVGYVVFRAALRSYYAAPLQDPPEPGDVLPDPGYGCPADAVRALHDRFTGG